MARNRWATFCSLGFPVLLQLYYFCRYHASIGVSYSNLQVSSSQNHNIQTLISHFPRLSMFLYKGTDSSFLSAFLDVLIGIILGGMIIIAALMITLGFMAWCENMTQRFPS